MPTKSAKKCFNVKQTHQKWWCPLGGGHDRLGLW